MRHLRHSARPGRTRTGASGHRSHGERTAFAEDDRVEHVLSQWRNRRWHAAQDDLLRPDAGREGGLEAVELVMVHMYVSQTVVAIWSRRCRVIQIRALVLLSARFVAGMCLNMAV